MDQLFFKVLDYFNKKTSTGTWLNPSGIGLSVNGVKYSGTVISKKISTLFSMHFLEAQLIQKINFIKHYRITEKGKQALEENRHLLKISKGGRPRKNKVSDDVSTRSNSTDMPTKQVASPTDSSTSFFCN